MDLRWNRSCILAVVRGDSRVALSLQSGIVAQLPPLLTRLPHYHHAGKGNVKIWGTSPDSIDIAEDRDRWMELLTRLKIRQPAGGQTRTNEQAFAKAHQLGYPVMIRPSYVLGGRSMEIIYTDEELTRYVCAAPSHYCVSRCGEIRSYSPPPLHPAPCLPLPTSAQRLASPSGPLSRSMSCPPGAQCATSSLPPFSAQVPDLISPHPPLHRYLTYAVEVSDETPVLVDKYLDRATELDVDALCDKDGNVVICGVMEHIEQAGIHSGEFSLRGSSWGGLHWAMPEQDVP